MIPTVVPVHAVCHELISDIYVKTDMHRLANQNRAHSKSVLVIKTSHDFNEIDKRATRLSKLLRDLPALQKKAEEQTGEKVERIDIRPYSRA